MLARGMLHVVTLERLGRVIIPEAFVELELDLVGGLELRESGQGVGHPKGLGAVFELERSKTGPFVWVNTGSYA